MCEDNSLSQTKIRQRYGGLRAWRGGLLKRLWARSAIYDTLLPHSEQYLALPSSKWSHTGHLRSRLLELARGLTNSISRTTMIVIIVPVNYSARIPRAQSITPMLSQPVRYQQDVPQQKRIDPINPTPWLVES